METVQRSRFPPRALIPRRKGFLPMMKTWNPPVPRRLMRDPAKAIPGAGKTDMSVVSAPRSC
jgi:hypothetical protein